MGPYRVIIKDTHRGLLYEDGVLKRVLEAGYHRIPRHIDLGFYRRPRMEIVLVDVRDRDLTIRGQEILTADKVAIRVSIIVQFRVTDPRAALHVVSDYEERLYTDVQLAARRSLATMPLDQILTNRNQLSEDILRDVKESAGSYGVTIRRADVKDLVFPGNLQVIMNRVLAAERMSEAQLVEARTKAEVERINSQTAVENRRLDAQADADARKLASQTEAAARTVLVEGELRELREREQAAEAYSKHPALLRLRELETLRELARNGNARIYIGFDKHMKSDGEPNTEA